MTELHVTERMESAIGQLAARYPARSPKAFYLGPDDWADFLATDPPMIDTTWNCLPARERAFNDVPVRRAKNVAPRQSRLYDNTGVGRLIDLPIKQDRRRNEDGHMVQTPRQRVALAEARVRKRGKADRTPEEWLELLGPDGGLMNWKSSPHVMWLAQQLGA